MLNMPATIYHRIDLKGIGFSSENSNRDGSREQCHRTQRQRNRLLKINFINKIKKKIHHDHLPQLLNAFLQICMQTKHYGLIMSVRPSVTTFWMKFRKEVLSDTEIPQFQSCPMIRRSRLVISTINPMVLVPKALISALSSYSLCIKSFFPGQKMYDAHSHMVRVTIYLRNSQSYFSLAQMYFPPVS